MEKSVHSSTGQIATKETDSNFRTIPDINYIKAFIKRSYRIIATSFFLISPFVLLKSLTLMPRFDSSIYLRFDPTDAIQLDVRNSEGVEFQEMAHFLAINLDDLSFIETLAQRLPPHVNKKRSIIDEIIKPAHLSFLSWLRSSSDEKKAQLDRGKVLRSKISFFTDLGIRGSHTMRIIATESSVMEAQKLASVTANILIEKFYEREITKIKTSIKSLNAFLDNEKVKKVVEDARVAAKERISSVSENFEASERLKEVKTIQSSNKARIREINEQIRTKISRRAKLEASLAEISQRYGPFHPDRRALENEISELRGKDGMTSLSIELKKLEEQLVEAENEAADLMEEKEERADKTVQRIITKLDQLKLEEQKLEEQIQKPENRTRLSIVDGPSTPTQNSGTSPVKVGLMGVAMIFSLGIILSLVKELRRDSVSEKWPAQWILNINCILDISRSEISKLSITNRRAIQGMKSEIMNVDVESTEVYAFQKIREFCSYIKNFSRGGVIVFIDGGHSDSMGEIVRKVVSIYSRDYAGRYLIVDAYSNEKMGHEEGHNGSTLIDVILQKESLDKSVHKMHNESGYDVIQVGDQSKVSLAEIASSNRFAEFLINAKRQYHKIFLLGLSSKNFVENQNILERSSDCVVFIDGKCTNKGSLKRQINVLDRSKYLGFMMLDN